MKLLDHRTKPGGEPKPLGKPVRRMLGWTGIAVWSCIAIGVGAQQVPDPSAGSFGPGRNSQGFPALPESANPHPDSNRLLEDSLHRMDNLKRISELNELRQKEMTSDTAKLVELANQLKAEMDKGGKGIPNMEEVRRVEEIEKLAHGVQSKMRATVSN
jgi:DNA topoisomerase VI subunit B